MKFKEIRGTSVDELSKRQKELREDLFEQKMKNSLGQLGNPLLIRKTRRDLARVLTALGQRRETVR